MSKDNKPTRVAVCSDQPVYLRGLAALVLSMPGFRMIAEARSASEAIQLCEKIEPDILLIDLKDIFNQGWVAANQVYQRWPRIKVILMVRSQDEIQVQEALEKAPAHWFSRDITEEEFKAAFEQVRQSVRGGEGELMGGNTPFEESEQLVSLGVTPGRQRSNEVLARELVMAGKIQADILPEEEPVIAGWEIAARLEPARETSGDYYDFIPISEHKWGVVAADVTDKGMGAALFMMFSSTLFRTYAARFPTLPALVLNAVSDRILTDSRGGMFVTAIFGILEPHTGRFIFANAGHPPGFLISVQRGRTTTERLRPTGMALGVSDQARWKQKIVRLAPGDCMLLYTDGITEAQNQQGDFFGEQRLLDVVTERISGPAGRIRDALLGEVHRFSGNTPRQDDIALVVIRRKEATRAVPPDPRRVW